MSAIRPDRRAIPLASAKRVVSFRRTVQRTLGAGAMLLMLTSQVSAEPLTWKAAWRDPGVVESVVIGTNVSVYAVMRFAVPKAASPNWTEPLPLDLPTRRALRLRSPEARAASETASDLFNLSLIAKSIAVDPWLVAAWARGSPNVGLKVFMINLQSYTAQLALNASTKRIVARARPYAAECESQLAYHPACEQRDRYRAFYSNHAAQTATGAGLACAHHQHLELYGNQAADALGCASSVALALAAGVGRISADEHWLTDVFAGQLVGFALGYLLPTLVHYRSGDNQSVDAVRQALAEPQPVLFTLSHQL